MTKKNLHLTFLIFTFFINGCYVFRTGPYESFYRNGQLKFSGNYDSGKKHGIFRSFSKNGVLISEEHFQNGQLHGKSIWFDEFGKPQTIAHYQN